MGRKGVLNSTVSLPNMILLNNNIENCRGKGRGRNGTNGRLLLVFGSPYTCQLCLTDPAWDNFAGGTKEDSLTEVFSFSSFFSFSAQLHAHVSRAQMSYTVLYTVNIGSHTRALYRYKVVYLKRIKQLKP